MDGFYSWGLPVGRIAGIQLRIHWVLLLFWAWELESILRRFGSAHRPYAIGIWAAGAGLLFGSILLHELGHAFAARRQGGYADEILLWPLGGLASCHTPDHWRSHLIVAAAGPAVTAVLLLLSWAGFLLADSVVSFDPWSFSWGRGLYEEARYVLVTWNLVILGFNLIPLYPLDGGRILHSGLWGFFQRSGFAGWGGYSRASRITLAVSRIAAIGGIAYGAATKQIFFVILFVWALLGAESLRER